MIHSALKACVFLLKVVKGKQREKIEYRLKKKANSKILHLNTTVSITTLNNVKYP